MTFFNLFYDHNKDPRVFDDLIPWEYTLMIQLMTQRIEEENLRLQQELLNKKNKR